MGRGARFGIQLYRLAPNCSLCEMQTSITQSLTWSGLQCGSGKVIKATLCKRWRGSSTKHVGTQEKGPPSPERREVYFLEEGALEP